MTDLRSVQTGIALVASLGGALLVVLSAVVWVLNGYLRADVDRVRADLTTVWDGLDSLRSTHNANVTETDARLDDHNVRLVAIADRLEAHLKAELANLEADRRHHAASARMADGLLARMVEIEGRVETVAGLPTASPEAFAEVKTDPADVFAALVRAFAATLPPASEAPR